jgi:hypothetical protein
MNRVTLDHDGQLYFGDKRIQADPLRYSGSEVRLAPTCTLRSFFRCLALFPALVALNPFLDSFVKYVPQCPEKGCHCEEIDHLVLLRTVEIIGHPAPPRMELSVSLAGFQGETRCDIRMYWLENLLDMPLKLGRLHHVVFGDALNSMQFDTVYTLFELIDGICWQLSFHNLPAVCRLTL